MIVTRQHSDAIAQRVGVDPVILLPVVLALIQALMECRGKDEEVVARKLRYPRPIMRLRIRAAVRRYTEEHGMGDKIEPVFAAVMEDCSTITAERVRELYREAKERRVVADDDTGEWEPIK
jgi:hypothetical protein